MTIEERLRNLADLLPSDESALTLTRADLVSLLGDIAPSNSTTSTRDLTVEEAAHEVHRAPSTVRGWLIAGDLSGYKLNHRDWRIPRAALQAYLKKQTTAPNTVLAIKAPNVDIAAWRGFRRS